jgi:hypothetical protein
MSPPHRCGFERLLLFTMASAQRTWKYGQAADGPSTALTAVLDMIVVTTSK